MSLAQIVRALGGDLYARGRRANIPGPGHSRTDRSVSLLLVGGRVIVHGFAGEDWREVLDHLQARGLVDSRGRLLRGGEPLPAADEPEQLSRRARAAAACALWAEARPIAGSLSERHCRGRGLAGPWPAALRHHPALAAEAYSGRGPRRPALLAAIHDRDGELVGIEITYLAAEGGRARMSLPRKTVGLAPAGSAVRLAEAGSRLLVGEGVFTTLSAAARFGWPAWALLSTRNLRAWRPPPGVRQVLVAGDRGRDGERSARILAAALSAAGIHGSLRFPPAPFGDWNDAGVAAAAVGGGGRTR
jgi:hypothetical protein